MKPRQENLPGLFVVVPSLGCVAGQRTALFQRNVAADHEYSSRKRGHGSRIRKAAFVLDGSLLRNSRSWPHPRQPRFGQSSQSASRTVPSVSSGFPALLKVSPARTFCRALSRTAVHIHDRPAVVTDSPYDWYFNSVSTCFWLSSESLLCAVYLFPS